MINFKPTVLTISANDPTGLAGLAADSRAITAMNCHVAQVVTALTAQNNKQFIKNFAVPSEVLAAQLDAIVCEQDYPVIKIGLLANAEQVQQIFAHDLLNNDQSYYQKHQLITGRQIILDPVLKSSSGESLADQALVEAIKSILPQVTLLTPNIDEAQILAGITINNSAQLIQAAKIILALGAQAVYIKGGHADFAANNSQGENLMQDYYADQQGTVYWSGSEKLSSGFNRGTGCAMASLIAGALAQQHLLPDAPVIAKMQMQQGFEQRYKLSSKVDEQAGTLALSDWHENLQPLPQVSAEFNFTSLDFASCQNNTEHAQQLGLYPVVDRAQWLERLLALGISTIQLRIKDLTGQALSDEIAQAVKISERFNARLFINDYWQLAIEHQAYGVHLGQEDVGAADLIAIKQAGLRLGLSSHCYYEVAQALAIKPSYLAFGPVYHTASKDMPWLVQGAKGLGTWRKLAADIPLVAIGGINSENFLQVKQQGVDSIAMISAITWPSDGRTAEQMAEHYLALWQD